MSVVDRGDEGIAEEAIQQSAESRVRLHVS
jgi:hypothetical protein